MNTLDNAVPLRGPLLAAHRNLRKAVDHRGAEVKSRRMVALFKHRGEPGALTADEVFSDIKALKELRQAMDAFGGPELIPVDSGFTEYLEGRVVRVHTLANSEFKLLFDTAFAEALQASSCAVRTA